MTVTYYTQTKRSHLKNAARSRSTHREHRTAIAGSWTSFLPSGSEGIHTIRPGSQHKTSIIHADSLPTSVHLGNSTEKTHQKAVNTLMLKLCTAASPHMNTLLITHASLMNTADRHSWSSHDFTNTHSTMKLKHSINRSHHDKLIDFKYSHSYSY